MPPTKYTRGKNPINLKNLQRGHYQKHSEESKQKMRETALRNGNRPPSRNGTTFSQTEETKNKIRKFLTGRKRPEISGEKCHLWKGGVTAINDKIRNSLEYKLWREAVFKRDNYTCIWCGDLRGKKSGGINADHIKPFAWFPELRFAIDNGRTLCESCHKRTESYMNRWFNPK